ncbi:SUKH-4 family immunity protein [Streptomyces sp. DSM 110735]|uniref:nucleic acid/nucleotide deaminase domain-containing protein n=1 Tax=Streptomyces sp. DSM 110735 TaxID=2775031 RepID=UPI0018F414D1|nr:nucleic acid/nucleotide deaminase domain-containing protein [Streptomyces sp. DSM 110735]MBJ7901870.1 SUKH-4 family immunity protein [Streptomyces sp. DSM 110735]
MTELPPDPAVTQFGPQGLRRISVPATYGTVPASARVHLAQVGVPLHVGPYFVAADETDGLTLGMYTGHRGVALQGEWAEWVRVGTDRLAHLCVRTDGSVTAVFPGRGEPELFVNSDIAAFTHCAAALDRALPVIAAADGLPSAAEAFAALVQEIRRIDPAAVTDRENWWSRVLDDVRHTLNFPFSSAFEYVTEDGGKQIVTAQAGPGLPHPEEQLWRRLASSGVEPGQVSRVYCELQPCMMPGHYCAAWLQAVLPDAEFTHSFDYGDTAESREEGIRELITHAARQAGQ